MRSSEWKLRKSDFPEILLSLAASSGFSCINTIFLETFQDILWFSRVLQELVTLMELKLELMSMTRDYQQKKQLTYLIILIHSFYRTDKNYYPPTLLEEGKNKDKQKKKKKVYNWIIKWLWLKIIIFINRLIIRISKKKKKKGL